MLLLGQVLESVQVIGILFENMSCRKSLKPEMNWQSVMRQSCFDFVTLFFNGFSISKMSILDKVNWMLELSRPKFVGF